MEAGKTYHIYNHANGFENLFQSEENYRYFLLRYQHFIEPVADTLAYCLMSNHVHFLVQIKKEAEIEAAFGKFETFQKLEARISKQFANLFSGYTQAFNKMYNRKGSLFIPNFKRKEIETDRHFTNIIHYIHANPVHHGFVKNIPDWPWSSYPEILSGKISTWLKREEIIEWFGNANEFVEFHRQPIDLKKELEID
ncbi:MAG: transposase [Bacteroidetes bacterium]|nr:transposase [Bacteroidota bacterium]